MRRQSPILLLITSILLMTGVSFAQDPSPDDWVNSGTDNVNTTRKVGIGTTTPSTKLTIAGGHADTALRLQSSGNGSDQPANLSLWASEPGWTFIGTGIGYNVNGYPYYGRIDSSRGSSYIRFLPDMTTFGFQNTSNADIQNVLVVKNNGNVDISGEIKTLGGASSYSGIGSVHPEVGDADADRPNFGTDSKVERINFHSGLSFSAHSAYGGIRFYNQGYSSTETNPYKLSGTPVMSITNGNVGIGTSNPHEKIEILKDSPSIEEGNFGFSILSGIGQTKLVLGASSSGAFSVIQSLQNGYTWINRPLVLQPNGGNVGIGTTNPGTYKLAVNGTIRAKEVKVETNWSDFVFEESYNLPTLDKVESYIKENKHLPDVPSAKEVEEEGLSMSQMMAKQMQKIEELTLYVIEQNKQLSIQNKKLESQNDEIAALKQELAEMKRY